MLFARRHSPSLPVLTFVVFVGVFSLQARAQLAGALGGPLDGLRPSEKRAFDAGQKQFHRDWGMKEGAGVVFTDGGCRRCHNAPNGTDGGGSDIRRLKFFGRSNTDGSFDPLDGTFPPLFLNEGGPLLQPFSNAAFIPGGICPQPGETLDAAPDHNVVEQRLAPAVFGFGLIDAIPDSKIQEQAVDKGDGIHGTANTITPQESAALARYPNVTRNSVGRFGRKGQIANLIFITASAFAHDIGVTNELVQDEDLPQGQPIDPACQETILNPNNQNITSSGPGIVNLSLFMRYLAPNPPGSGNSRGLELFGSVAPDSIHCDKCHLQSYTTPATVNVYTDLNGTTISSPALSNQTVSLYSDLLLHDMGNSLKGAMPAGLTITSNATVSQWRTAPLWGLSLRNRYLHDARADTLDSAIRLHSDGTTGEAKTVIDNYKALSADDQLSLQAFIDSL